MLKAMKEMEKDLQRGKLKGTDGQILQQKLKFILWRKGD